MCYVVFSAPGAHAGYNPDGSLAWENQHMQMGAHGMYRKYPIPSLPPEKNSGH